MTPSLWTQHIARVTAAGALAVLTSCGLADAAARTYDLPSPTIDAPLAQAKGHQTLVLAGGCFWGVEAVFAHVKGVISATSGYSGGEAATANYDAVSTGRTGHAESVKIVYDPSQVTIGQLLKVFFSVAHDPTELDRQGPDRGTQYRSAIFYQGSEQKRVIQAYIDQLRKAKIYPSPIVTQVTPLVAFYPAESYHQNYLALHPDQPYIVINDIPKIEALKAKFPAIFRNG